MSNPSSPPAAAARSDGQDYLEAFRGPIEPVEASATYQMALAVVAGAMVLLPLLYFLLIAGIGYGLYYHFQYDGWILEASSGTRSRRSEGGKFALYLAPYLVGGGLMVFLIKPLFARQPKQLPPQPLDPDQEPLLFAFVERICAAVGAPIPRHIYVNCDVNASAGFRRGIWSMFGDDLALTIGLPLIAGLSVRQLAGVLAHEFGHFSQGTAMRVTYIIRSVNAWFARLVYDRDGWDEMLVEWSDTDFRISIWVYLVRAAIWFTRKILWCFMMAGHGISCFMMRQMEFDADLYETRLAGSTTFAETSQRMRMLALAAEGAFQDLGQSWDEKRLADDLPMLIMANVEQIPPAIAKKYLAKVDEATTGAFDSHPSDKERIERARAENAPGVFHLEAPAAGLFANFPVLSRAFTKRYYNEVLGPQVKGENLVSTSEIVARAQKTRDEDKVSQRYFQGQVWAIRPLFLNTAQILAPADPKASLARLREVRPQMIDAVPRIKELWKKYLAADDLFLKGVRASTLLRANVPVAAAEFDLPTATIQNAEMLQRRASQEIQGLLEDLKNFEQLGRTRLTSALELLHMPQVQARVTGAQEDLIEMRRMVESLSALEGTFGRVLELRRSLTSITALVEKIEEQRANESFFHKLRDHMSESHGYLRDIYQRLGTQPYPFEHAGEPMSVAHFALVAVPDEENLGGLLQAWDGLGRLVSLYFRHLGSLTRIAEKVETAVGLAPLPDVEPEPDPDAEAEEEGEGTWEMTPLPDPQQA